MFNVLKLLITCSVATFGTIAQANPINIFGVDWSMSYDEMVTNFENRGYGCKYLQDQDAISCIRDHNPNNRENAFFDNRTIRVIFLIADTVTFNCNVFNGCEFSVEDICKILIEQGLAREFEFEKDPLNGLEYYISIGNAGDGLMVFKNPTNSPLLHTPVVRLFKGTYGSGVTFD